MTSWVIWATIRLKQIIKRRFTWPSLSNDVVTYCHSCTVCQKCSNAPAGHAPMIEWQVTTEPFEVLAFDLVGPLPKAKGGFRFILTSICMATKWPEAIARTGIPVQLLTDQGPQFVGSFMKQICENLNIDKVLTTPYRPETNGVIERMHGTVGAMLRKAAAKGLDWVQQLPFAKFALRAAPNRDTLMFPYELIYGRQACTPLDILHHGWVEQENFSLDVSEWSKCLAESLEVLRDVMRERVMKAVEDRKTYYDKKSVTRELCEGDFVWCRVQEGTAY